MSFNMDKLLENMFSTIPRPYKISITWDEEVGGPPPEGFEPVNTSAMGVFAVLNEEKGTRTLNYRMPPDDIASALLKFGNGAIILEEARHLQEIERIRKENGEKKNGPHSLEDALSMLRASAEEVMNCEDDHNCADCEESDCIGKFLFADILDD